MDDDERGVADGCPEQDYGRYLGLSGDRSVLSIIPDVTTEQSMSDKPLVEPIRTADEAGSGQQEERRRRQDWQKDAGSGETHGE